MTLTRDFLATQQRREEGLLAEIRGLRASLPLASQVLQIVSRPHLIITQTLPTLDRLVSAETPSTKTWKWPETEWACRLLPLLSRKALEAYTAMDEDKAHCYTDLKAALLVKFDISPETYWQQFRSTSVPCGENRTETYHRLKGLYRHWIRPSSIPRSRWVKPSSWSSYSVYSLSR